MLIFSIFIDRTQPTFGRSWALPDPPLATLMLPRKLVKLIQIKSGGSFYSSYYNDSYDVCIFTILWLCRMPFG